MNRLLGVFFLFVCITTSATTDLNSDVSYIEERICLAKAIFKEAGGSTLKAKRAVYDIVQNRMRTQNFSACQVVYAPRQFSWTNSKIHVPINKEMLDTLVYVEHHKRVLPRDAMWFHNNSVTPAWAAKMKVVARIDGQVFYSKGNM